MYLVYFTRDRNTWDSMITGSLIVVYSLYSVIVIIIARYFEPCFISWTCCPVRCDPVSKWVYSVSYLMAFRLVLDTPWTAFRFLSDKKAWRQHRWLVVLQVICEHVVFMWRTAATSPPAPVLFYSIFLTNYRHLLHNFPCSFILCDLYLSLPNKTGILMLSPQLYMSPQEDINYLEL